MKKFSFIDKYYLAPWLVNLVLILYYLSSGLAGTNLFTSVINVNIKADPFDGTVMPFNMVPDYRVMTDKTLSFTEIDSTKFIDIPEYDPSVFGKDLDDLTYGTAEYKEAQIAKLIYTVPYMGNYKLDYKEYAGSHLAIDIKAPIGTPVKSIANGVVVLSDYQSSGYGHVIVVRHENINYNGETVDLYSGYAHLSERSVKAGDKVSRGDTIGLVGNTGGTSTGSHLHFQIDVADAPYHLYWPFSSADTRDAGVSFYGGINAGIGRENAMKYTIHPINFVYKYENNNIDSDNISVVIDEPEEDNNTDNNNEEEETILSSVDSAEEDVKEDEEENTQEDNEDNKEDEKPEKEIEKEEKTVVTSVNIDDKVVSSIGDDFSSGFESSELNINSYDTFSLLDEEEQEDNSDDEKLEFNSAPEEPEAVEDEEDDTEENSKEEEEEDYDEEETEDEEEQEEEKFSAKDTKFSDVKSSNKYYRAIEYFRKKGLLSGYSDGTFKPDNSITRIENLKMLSVGLGLGTIENNDKQYFKDVSKDSWQLKYVNKFVALNILSLDNEYFNPNNNITRVEGLKLLIKSKVVNTSLFAEMKVDVTDVSPTDWYYPYVVYAIKNDLLEYSNNKFEPNKQLTRGEVVNMMYLLK